MQLASSCVYGGFLFLQAVAVACCNGLLLLLLSR